ncbi:MAG: response regulator [Schwartzia sp.]|nr:response regulator [Schwartzia sp. (in: firmicutes)]
MIQKTLVTDNIDELSEYAQGLKNLPEYEKNGGKQVAFGAVAVAGPDAPEEGAVPLERRLAKCMERTAQELEDSAAEADDAAKPEFLAMLARKIRTPLNAILGMNEMILRESVGEDVLIYAKNVQTASLSLLGVVNEILDFSKIEAGKMEIAAREYDLALMIGDLESMIRVRVGERGLDLHVKADPETPRFLIGDELRVRQVVASLLTNALKYTEKGSVTFSVDYKKTSEDGIALEVSVEDSDFAADEEHLHKPFKASGRVDGERARKAGAADLGLMIARQLLRLMGSRLEEKNDCGKGSVFSFSLPQRVADWEGVGEAGDILGRSGGQRAKRKTRFTAPKARILVVDDAPMHLAVISGLLKRTRMQVDTAESGEECLEKFAANAYDLVFLDHRMPYMDGVETLGRMKELCPDRLAGVPVVCLTANVMPDAREQYMAAGFSDYLSKPVMVDELEEMILKYLPQDKMGGGEETGREEEETEPELPGWLFEVPTLHTDTGILYCGGVREYLDSLAFFAASIPSRTDEIERLYLKEEYGNYTIKVHSLKSMAKAVGAIELSDLAAAMEAAGKAGDIESIQAGTETLLAVCRGLAAPLARLGDDPELAKRVRAANDDVGTEKRHTVLLVDDDEDFLALASRWLKKEYAVTAAGSGKEALELLENERPDLMLIDYEMPGMSGADVLKVVRETPKTADLPVIFLTGTEDRENVKRAENLRPEGFLSKAMGKKGLLMGISAFFD